jgi:hypothetical protein
MNDVRENRFQIECWRPALPGAAHRGKVETGGQDLAGPERIMDQ